MKSEGKTIDVPKSILKQIKQGGLGVVASDLNPSSLEVEGTGSRIQGHPQSHSKFKASLNYMRPCLRKRVKSI